MRSGKALTIVYFFLLVVVLSYAADFRHCDNRSKAGDFKEVTVSGCSKNEAVCNLIRGTNASISISFEPNKNVSLIKAVVHGCIAGARLPFPFPFANVCDDTNSGIQCPLNANETVTYRTSLPILKTYPSLPSVTIQWELQDENSEDIVCVLIPARLT